ncbi:MULTISPECIES: hypothetical protein [Gammaproteobacteria]|nr:MULTISPECIES: hypothetical protein [Gammaproteobacteria]MBE4074794.1 hypothetical protein [Vibrio parahaemolyticus]QLQ94426.1 hypothetical protein H0907_03800 [Providencia rettgeri]HEK0780462.1 hypothetical protein [Proteus mirabilis]MBL4247309.1 hypothetical protein [Vibrio fluvialis]MBL4255843.1 hypothetical protein [Vibrio fluvialis]
MAVETINREAGDSGKGFRLQLIRAIKLMLQTIQQDRSTVFFTAVENLEDVSHQTIVDGEVSNYFEEDKNYDLNGNFTIFSPPVINTLVSFYDIYVDQFRTSNSVYLGFYTTRDVGKERKSKLNSGKEIALPEKPILEILQSFDDVSDDTINLVKEILVEEYASQYKEKPKSGNLETLRGLNADMFKEFLRKILWHFGQEDEDALKQTVLTDIENSPLHNNAHIGKEKIIFCLLMDKLSEKQNSKNLVDKLVHSSDVKLIFKEAESQIPDESIDPTWRYIAELEKDVTDKRNLKEKVLSVIEDISDRRIRLLARKASGSKYEEREADKSFLSLKYRVFEACEEYFSDDGYVAPESGNDLDAVLQTLLSKAVEDISKLKTDYKYTISNDKTIEGIIWNLFDGCFLAFDECSDE